MIALEELIGRVGIPSAAAPPYLLDMLQHLTTSSSIGKVCTLNHHVCTLFCQ